jgi:hypothetical protein
MQITLKNVLCPSANNFPVSVHQKKEASFFLCFILPRSLIDSPSQLTVPRAYNIHSISILLIRFETNVHILFCTHNNMNMTASVVYWSAFLASVLEVRVRFSVSTTGELLRRKSSGCSRKPRIRPWGSAALTTRVSGLCFLYSLHFLRPRLFINPEDGGRFFRYVNNIHGISGHRPQKLNFHKSCTQQANTAIML